MTARHADLAEAGSRDTAHTAAPALDQALAPLGPQPRKFVRVIEHHANGLVKFEFAVGWPDLSCELALPAPLFDAFCSDNHVEFLTEPAEPAFAPTRHGDDA